MKRPSQTVTPDLTPMIDVVFLLLIFFLTTISFRVLEGRFETHLPKDQGSSSVELTELLEPLDIRVAREHVTLAHRRVPRGGDLASLVGPYVRAQPDLRARIATESGVDYGRVIEVVDACLAAGLSDLTFATTPLDG